MIEPKAARRRDAITLAHDGEEGAYLIRIQHMISLHIRLVMVGILVQSSPM